MLRVAGASKPGISIDSHHNPFTCAPPPTSTGDVWLAWQAAARGISIMPRRLTLRELEARRRRAEEGMERFKAAHWRMGEDAWRRERQEGFFAALFDPSFERFVNEVLEEMEAAVEMIREGLPKTTVEVGFRLDQHCILCSACMIVFLAHMAHHDKPFYVSFASFPRTVGASLERAGEPHARCRRIVPPRPAPSPGVDCPPNEPAPTQGPSMGVGCGGLHH